MFGSLEFQNFCLIFFGASRHVGIFFTGNISKILDIILRNNIHSPVVVSVRTSQNSYFFIDLPKCIAFVSIDAASLF